MLQDKPGFFSSKPAFRLTKMCNSVLPVVGAMHPGVGPPLPPSIQSNSKISSCVRWIQKLVASCLLLQDHRGPVLLVCLMCDSLSRPYSMRSRALLLLLLLLLLSRFSHVQLCATPETAAHQAPPSLGFSRQECWSGLPFPSPMRESEK